MGLMTNNQIAIIPARGGSKRLPRKNILPINGHPIIGFPIQAALLSGLFDDVIVSTEDTEVRKIAEGFGATVIHRPAELADDKSSVAQVCRHILEHPDIRPIERFCIIYATAVLLRPTDLIRARELMDQEPQADYVLGVSTYHYPPLKALRTENGYLTSMWPEEQLKKTQEHPKLVVSNGTLCWARTEAFLRDKNCYGRRLKGYQLEAIDIDTAADYQAAQKIAAERGLKIAGAT